MYGHKVMLLASIVMLSVSQASAQNNDGPRTFPMTGTATVSLTRGMDTNPANYHFEAAKGVYKPVPTVVDRGDGVKTTRMLMGFVTDKIAYNGPLTDDSAVQ